jgi:hypothetical protein
MSISSFGKSDSYFNKRYIDYLITQISSKHKLSDEENNLISNARRKFYFISFIKYGIVGILISIVYRRGKLINSLNLDMNISDKLIDFPFAVKFISLCFGVYYMNYLSHKVYYNDLKYLIKLHSSIEPKQFYNSIINKQIMEKYPTT